MSKLSGVIQMLSLRMQRHLYQLKREVTGLPEDNKTMILPWLYVGGQYKIRGLDKLKKWGITGVINMRQASFKQASHADWLDYLHLPTQDLTPPSIEKLDAGVAFINKHKTHNGKVYVHCRWGEGRGPTMAAAYLISRGMSTDQSLDAIRDIRNFIRLSDSQLSRLREYEAYLRRV